MVNPESLKDFDAQVAYEALHESINTEIARHNHLVEERAGDAGEVARHEAAIDSLLRAQRQISPDNPEALEVATLILTSFRDIKVGVSPGDGA